MKRRTFLWTAAAAAAAATWPDWVRRAFADVSIEPAAGDGKVVAPSLAEVLRRAKQANRPALLFVIPEDGSARYERGHLFGEYLNHATDEQLAPLALAEVGCATMAEIAAAGVQVEGGGEPLMALVTPDGRGHRLAALLPSWREGGKRGLPRDDENSIIAKRIDGMAALVRRGLADDRKLSADSIATLAAEAKQRYRQKPPPGSHWALGGGCGTRIEDDPDEGMMVACGMGYVPAKSARFLYLFAKTPGEARRERMKQQGRGTTL